MRPGKYFLPDKTVVLAPVAGFTDLPFRMTVKKFGADLVYTELVSAEGLRRGGPKSLNLLATDPAEQPVAAQIFGATPEAVAQAAGRVAEEPVQMIDLNMGCPQKKITGPGAGAALLKNPALAESVLRAFVRAVDGKLPVSCKIRSGWDNNSVNAVTIAKIAEQAGVAMIAVHGRTAKQMFAGEADWNIIADVKRAVSIPVIGNGDIHDPHGAKKRFDETGVDGLMVGRAALAKPWLINQIKSFVATGAFEEVSNSEQLSCVLGLYISMRKFYGDNHAARVIRARMGYITKGMIGGGRFRAELNHTNEPDKVERLINLFYRTGSVESDEHETKFHCIPRNDGNPDCCSG